MKKGLLVGLLVFAVFFVFIGYLIWKTWDVFGFWRLLLPNWFLLGVPGEVVGSGGGHWHG